MQTFPDLRLRALVEDDHPAQQLLDPNQHVETRDSFAAVRARARRLGIDPAYAALATRAVPFHIPATPGSAC